ncbi:NAD(P)-binding protein [Rhizodiscina lignyota]|uniref:NAD(P)-binding protein n=1 Tax=Rhizodiscina lignyota TaxID=1504668 RepID=A0A9P4M703_9PEZI|nr:NAD(P)-binding protein [Rhizodiscina lignyota]
MAATTAKGENAPLDRANLFDVSHITALVTGGGTGIGLMITQALVANGAKVYITGRREEALEQTTKVYNTGPGSLHSLPGDVSKKSEILDLASQMDQMEPDGIQLLVNNAGIARDDATKFSTAGQPDMKDADSIHNHFIKSDPQAWEDTFRTNVTGQFFTSMAFLPLLAKGRNKINGYSSSIINVSSVSGQMKGSSGGQFAYATSKAAFSHMTRMLATTFKDVGVRVNCIAPGLFPSEMTTGESDETNKSEIDKPPANPAGRTGADSDMAATVLFLAGPGGLFYNEQFLYPDGGSTLVNPAAK